MSARGHGAVRSAGVAVGDDAVGDLDAGRGEGGDRAGRPEVDVVGVGGDDQDAADPVLGRPDGRSVAASLRGRSPRLGGVQAARSASRGSLENISTIGIRRPSRRWMTSISTSWFHSDQAHHDAGLAGPGRAARAVQVGLVVLGWVVVDRPRRPPRCAGPGPPRRWPRGRELAVREVGQRPLAVGLAQVAVDGGGL